MENNVHLAFCSSCTEGNALVEINNGGTSGNGSFTFCAPLKYTEDAVDDLATILDEATTAYNDNPGGAGLETAFDDATAAYNAAVAG